MSMQQFKPGDVVQLKSGGPAMTVDSMSDETWLCQWFENSTLRSESFRPAALQPVPPAGVSIPQHEP